MREVFSGSQRTFVMNGIVCTAAEIYMERMAQLVMCPKNEEGDRDVL